ncbi:hypothetical protein BC941DRAFT_259976 [Chlamydoabsidia padenii]|nr:hypothetical protein BC941DRAFT_259976 [Chlamydoabsidia padenii]
MTNQSFSYVHPCDSSFYLNKMLNDERNESGLNNLNVENQKVARNQPHHHQQRPLLLNNNPVNLYEYQHIAPKDLPHSDSSNRYSPSTTKFAHSSHSVPSSRRNSNEKDSNGTTNTKQSLESLFNSKLQLGPTDQNMPSIPDSNAFFHQDGSFGQSSHRSPLATIDGKSRHLSQQSSTLADMSSTHISNATSEGIMSSFAFDHDNPGNKPYS